MPELGTVGLMVIRCLICGWRVYPPGRYVEDDFDGSHALIRFLDMSNRQRDGLSRQRLMNWAEDKWDEIREEFTNG